MRQRCFEIKCASVYHVAHAKVQSLCQEGTKNSERDIKCIEGYTIASNTFKCKAVDCKDGTGDFDWKCELHAQVVRCSSIACEHFTHFCGTTFSGLCHLHLQIWISFERLRYGKKEFLLGAYEVPHLTCQPINCTLEDAFIAKMIDLSGGFLPSSFTSGCWVLTNG